MQPAEFKLLPPRDTLPPGSSGIIFRCKANTSQQVHSEILHILETLVKSINWWRKIAPTPKLSAPVIGFSKFIFASDTEDEDIHVYVCDQRRERIMEGTRYLLGCYLDQVKKKTSGIPACMKSLVPFDSSCVARSRDFRAVLHIWLEESIRVMRARATDSNLILPYDVSVEIFGNKALEREKDSINETIHERLAKCKDILVLDRNFARTLADPVRNLEDMSMLFKVVVLGSQAYFGDLHQPHAVNNYEFTI